MRSRAWTIAAALFALGGCTTTYVGQKIGADGALTKQGGVPFTMTKPEYVVSIAPDPVDGTKGVYTLTAQDVPDASQRFTLALDPALFVNGKLDLDFGNNGNLTGAASTTSSRIIDTFGSIVGLALKAQTAGLLDAATTLTAYEAKLQISADPRCTKLVAGAGSVTVKQAIQDSINEVREEAEKELGERPNAKRAQAELIGERLHYLNAAERDCMVAVVDDIKKKQEMPAENRYKQALLASDAAAASNAELKAVNSQIKAEVAALNEDALTKIADGLGGKSDPFPLARTAAREGAQFVNLRLASRFARSLADMGPDVWRSRHLLYLERKIATCRVESLLPGSKLVCGEGTKMDARIASATHEWSRTLGGTDLVERIARIDSLLATSPTDKQGRHSGVEEHVKLREERDRLRGRIDLLRSELIAKNKVVALGPVAPKAANVEPRTNVPVTLVKKAYVETVNAKPAEFKALPEFVLVLEPDDAAAVAPLPPPAGGSK